MNKNLNKIILSFVLLTTSLSTNANECSSLFLNLNQNANLDFSKHKEIGPAQQAIYRYLNRKALSVELDQGAQDLSLLTNDLRKLFLGTSTGEFNQLFKLVSKEEVLAIASLVVSGSLPATETQVSRFIALKKFIENDKNNVFWKSESPWDALHTYYPEFQGPGHLNNVGGVIAGVDTHAMTELQREIVAAARGKSSRIKRGNWFQRIMNHPYYKVQPIIEFNDQVRLRLEYIEGVKTALEKELIDEGKLGLEMTKAELTKIEDYFNLLRILRKKVIKDLEKAYGQDITTGGVIIIPKDADIYVISGKIKQNKLIQSDWRGDFILEAESVVNSFHDLFNTVRLRQGLPERTEQDMDIAELRIRHHQYKRESSDKSLEWASIMEKSSGQKINVDYHWTETVIKTRTVFRNGKMEIETYTEQVTRYGSSTVSLSYYEILANRIRTYTPGKDATINGRDVTIDAVSGKEKILEESKDMATVESRLYYLSHLLGKFQEAISQHAKILALESIDQKDYRAQLKNLQKNHELILKLIRMVDAHLKIGKKTVLDLWKHDSFEHFQARNKVLREGLLAQKELYETYITQFEKRDYELVVEADKLDHSKDNFVLKMKAFAQNSLLALGITTPAAITTLYHVNPEVKSYIDGVYELLKASIGM